MSYHSVVVMRDIEELFSEIEIVREMAIARTRVYLRECDRDSAAEVLRMALHVIGHTSVAETARCVEITNSLWSILNDLLSGPGPSREVRVRGVSNSSRSRGHRHPLRWRHHREGAANGKRKKRD